MIYIHSSGPGGFEWDAHNVAHIARHGLQPAEVEQAIAGEPATLSEGLTEAGERRWVTVGRTAAGRLAAVVWTVRGARVRIVTAYPASGRQQVAYEEAKCSNSGAEVSPDPEFQD
jgi:hypothetical protein